MCRLLSVMMASLYTVGPVSYDTVPHWTFGASTLSFNNRKSTFVINNSSDD